MNPNANVTQASFNKSLLAAVFALSLIGLPLESFAAKVIGQFQVVKGKVEIISKRGRKKKASFGKRVKEGDTIVTAKDSRAKVVMLDKNIIHVSPESRMKFDKYNQKIAGKTETALDVLYGKVRSNVKQKYDEDKTKFRVKTKAAVAGVRGTDFLCGYDPNANKADFVTFEGEIEVGLLGPDGSLTNSVKVPEGKTSSTELGNTPGESKKMDQKKYESEKKGTETQGGKDTYDEKAPDGDGKDGGDEKKKEDGGENNEGSKEEGKDGEKKKEGSDDKGGKKDDGGGDYGDDSFDDDSPVGDDEPGGEGPDGDGPPIEKAGPPPIPKPPDCGLPCRDVPQKTNLGIDINLEN